MYVVLLAVDDKLHWTFKLYDVDGNGEIDIFEMEKMFVSLCSIVESSENDQLKRNRNSASKSSMRRFVITEKAPTRAFSWLKAATTAFTLKTLLRHYAKRVLTLR